MKEVKSATFLVCVLSSSCVFTLLCVPAAGPVHGVGLVGLPGRLWPTHVQVPAGESSHGSGPAGEVSGGRRLGPLPVCFTSFRIALTPSLLSFGVAVAVQSLQGVGAFFFFLPSLALFLHVLSLAEPEPQPEPELWPFCC